MDGRLQLSHATLTILGRLPEAPLQRRESQAEVADDLAARLGECERLFSSGVRLGSSGEVEVGDERPNRGGCRCCGDRAWGGGS